MSDLFDDAIDSIYDSNPSRFQDAINDILSDKLRERIGVEKVAVAQNFLNEPDYEEEVADEEV